MKVLFGILFLILVSACGNEKPKAVITQKSEIDSLTKQEEPQQVVKEIQPKRFNIDSFLQKPFDLYEFKKKKGGANSGGANVNNNYFKPKYKGFYYRFFLFGGTGRCYFGKKTMAKVNGFKMITYKPFGEYEREYLDPKEELIYLRAFCNYKELPQLAFVGFDTTYAVNKLGNYTFKRKEWLIYTSNKKALVLKTKGSTVVELRYLYMNKTLQKEEDIDVIVNDE